MTTYHVGAEGATVFDEHGRPVGWLKPGQTVVAGSTELTDSPAAFVNDAIGQAEAKRVRGYADKAIHVDEDKA
jgi:hypothetical protein